MNTSEEKKELREVQAAARLAAEAKAKVVAATVLRTAPCQARTVAATAAAATASGVVVASAALMRTLAHLYLLERKTVQLHKEGSRLNNRKIG
jgi:hypothetical protein